MRAFNAFFLQQSRDILSLSDLLLLWTLPAFRGAGVIKALANEAVATKAHRENFISA